MMTKDTTPTIFLVLCVLMLFMETTSLLCGPGTPCAWGSWNSWSSCSGNIQTRSRWMEGPGCRCDSPRGQETKSCGIGKSSKFSNVQLTNTVHHCLRICLLFYLGTRSRQDYFSKLNMSVSKNNNFSDNTFLDPHSGFHKKTHAICYLSLSIIVRKKTTIT